MIANAYICKNFLRAMFFVLPVLVVLFSFINLTEALESVGEGSYTVYDAVTITLLHVPKVVIELLPVSVLLSGLIGLGAMANHEELTALRAAGLSVEKLLCILSGIAVANAFVALVIVFFIVPLCETQAHNIKAKSLDESGASNEFWSRKGNRIIRVGQLLHGRIPSAIEIYELDYQEKISSVITAERAEILDHTRWILYEVRKTIIKPYSADEQYLKDMMWNSFLSNEQIRTLIRPSEALSPTELIDYLKRTQGSVINTLEQEILLWKYLSLPFSILAMTLITVPLVVGTNRPRSGGLRVVIGALIGLSFHLFQQLTSQIAVLHSIPTTVAFLSPPFLISVLVIFFVRPRKSAR